MLAVNLEGRLHMEMHLPADIHEVNLSAYHLCSSTCIDGCAVGDRRG